LLGQTNRRQVGHWRNPSVPPPQYCFCLEQSLLKAVTVLHSLEHSLESSLGVKQRVPADVLDQLFETTSCCVRELLDLVHAFHKLERIIDSVGLLVSVNG